MTRREVIWLVSRVAGTAAGSAFFSEWMSAAHVHSASSAPPEPDRWSNYRPQFFSEADFQALDCFASILIPTDDTPGAREAHVAPFIDFVVFSAAEYAPDTQRQWRKAMDFLRGREFGVKTPDQQFQIVQEMSASRNSGSDVFQMMKDLIVFAFYTSRAGLIGNLHYQGLAYLTEFPGCTHPEHTIS